MITLTQDQENARKDFMAFLSDPDETNFVISGYAGTGKSTLVSTILEDTPKMLKAINLLTQKNNDTEIVCAATTNKACEVFAAMSGYPVKTVHKTLGLTIRTDYKNNTQKIIEIDKSHYIKNAIIFIDEASYLDAELIAMITKKCSESKIVYIGDPAQLAPIKRTVSPVFNLGFKTAKLTKIMRQAGGNPIIELSAMFREVVNGGDWFQTNLDNNHLVWLERNDFFAKIIQEFSSPNLKGDSAKVLAYTNKTVINYNKSIRAKIKGLADLQIGDYATVNKSVNTTQCKVNTDQEVCITDARDIERLGVHGRQVEIDGYFKAFLPNNLEDKKARLKKAKADNDWYNVRVIEEEWIDLRSVFSCTINKSQGSTYDAVFIDLDDVRKCTSGNLMSRLMYVAVSRARYNVYFTGSLSKVAQAA